jgi:hypothetical protein
MITRKKIIYPKSKTRKMRINASKIPVVIICWNSLSFIKKLVDQLKHYPNPIILLDNKSSYKPLFEYYKQIKEELKDKIDIRLLNKNYGSNVYLEIKNTLPKVFMLTDSDIEINKKMPQNFAEILFKLSEQYKVYKIGLALNLKDKDTFVRCAKKGNPLYEYQLRYWKHKIPNKKYELYHAAVDTTFCLVNSKFMIRDMNPIMPAIRIAGDFTARHLSWYKHILTSILPSDELYMYLKNNKSSTFVRRCIRPMLSKTLKHNIHKDSLNENVEKINI